MAPIVVTDKETLALVHDFYRDVKNYKSDGLALSHATKVVKMGKYAILLLPHLLTVVVFNNEKFAADYQPGSDESEAHKSEAQSTSTDSSSSESESESEAHESEAQESEAQESEATESSDEASGDDAKTSPAINKEKAKTTAAHSKKAKTTAAHSKKATTAAAAPATPIKMTVLKGASPGKVEVTPRKSSAQLFDRGSLPHPQASRRVPANFGLLKQLRKPRNPPPRSARHLPSWVTRYPRSPRVHQARRRRVDMPRKRVTR